MNFSYSKPCACGPLNCDIYFLRNSNFQHETKIEVLMTEIENFTILWSSKRIALKTSTFCAQTVSNLTKWFCWNIWVWKLIWISDVCKTENFLHIRQIELNPRKTKTRPEYSASTKLVSMSLEYESSIFSKFRNFQCAEFYRLCVSYPQSQLCQGLHLWVNA